MIKEPNKIAHFATDRKRMKESEDHIKQNNDKTDHTPRNTISPAYTTPEI
jgi:hypothetical protein